jgi:Zn-finger nucleic acid-binding protein
MVENARECPICEAGRGGKRPPDEDSGEVLCLNCELPLETQDWEGVTVHMCTSCQATLFPPRALESVLDKLRDATEQLDFEEVVKELRDPRAGRKLAKSVRYRTCPQCRGPMSRRNYGETSGIILEVCNAHGSWVEQQSFAELSDWISRGGDQLSWRARHRQGYEGPRFGR